MTRAPSLILFTRHSGTVTDRTVGADKRQHAKGFAA